MQVSLRVDRLDAFILIHGLLAVVELDLLEDELLVLGDFETKQFKIEIEVAHGISCRLIIFKMQSFHVRMGQSLVNRDSTSWVKCEHLLNQVDGMLISSSKKFIEVLTTGAW